MSISRSTGWTCWWAISSSTTAAASTCTGRATPAATAARASTGTNSRSPPDEVPWAPEFTFNAGTEYTREIGMGIEMVARLERQNEAHLKAERDAYLDRVMPVAEKIYFEAYKASTGLKGFTY